MIERYCRTAGFAEKAEPNMRMGEINRNVIKIELWQPLTATKK